MELASLTLEKIWKSIWPAFLEGEESPVPGPVLTLNTLINRTHLFLLDFLLTSCHKHRFWHVDFPFILGDNSVVIYTPEKLDQVSNQPSLLHAFALNTLSNHTHLFLLFFLLISCHNHRFWHHDFHLFLANVLIDGKETEMATITAHDR